jgi:hypothetical protein
MGHGCEDNIKTDLKETGLDVDWIFPGPGWGEMNGCCECGDELLVSIDSGNFLPG